MVEVIWFDELRKELLVLEMKNDDLKIGDNRMEMLSELRM